MPKPKKPIVPIELPEYPIWERQPGDTAQWFAVLERYRLAGVRRTKLGIYRAFQAEKSMGMDGEKIRKGAKRHGENQSRCLPQSWRDAWIKYRIDERCAAWDEWRSEENRMLWQERFEASSEEFWNKRNELLERVSVMLKVPLIEKQIIAATPDGRPQIVNFHPVGWNFRDLLAALKLAAELTNFAIGDVNMAKATIERYGGRVVIDEATPAEDQLSQLYDDEFLS